jgi:hypothetical protein
MKTRRGGMWGVKSDKTVDRKVKEIVQLYHLGDIPLTNRSRNEDIDLKDELRTILRGVDRSLLHAIIVKIKEYPHSERFVEAIRTMGGRKTRGGWPWSTFKADVFADEIVANLFNDSYPFTEKINTLSYTNLNKVMNELFKKDETVEGETRERIIARLRQMNAKKEDYERNGFSLSKVL